MAEASAASAEANELDEQVEALREEASVKKEANDSSGAEIALGDARQLEQTADLLRTRAAEMEKLAGVVGKGGR